MLLMRQANQANPTSATPPSTAQPRTLIRRPKGGAGGIDAFFDPTNHVWVDAGGVTDIERANAMVGDDINYGGSIFFPANGGGRGSDNANLDGPPEGGLAGTGMPGGVGPDPAAIDGGYSGGGNNGGPSSDPGSDNGGQEGAWAKGGPVFRHQLKGKNPPGPDDGKGNLDAGEHVLPAAEVSAVGGHKNVEAIRHAMREYGPDLLRLLKMPTMRRA